MEQKYLEFEFNFASFSLKPYSGNHGTSSQILKQVILKLNESDFPSEKRIIDKHKNRKNTVSRKLVMISNSFSDSKGQRCFGKIALIKNKAPLLWGGKDIVEEIEKAQNKQFIDITNYTIHFSQTADPIIMFEFNSDGPRLSDIEYYIRQIAKEFNIGKNINTSLHLNITYEELDKQISNIFAVTVKVVTGHNNKVNWFKQLQKINEQTGYKDVRLEFSYNRIKDKVGAYKKNIIGLDFARGIIEWLKRDKNNIEYIEDLKMSYETNDNQNIIDLDFKKNKVVSFLEVPLHDNKVYKQSDFKEIVGQEFNQYLISGKTNTYS